MKRINAKTASQLAINSTVELVQDKSVIANFYNGKLAGATVTIVRHDAGNNRFYFKCTKEEAQKRGIPDYDWSDLEKGMFYLGYECIAGVTGKVNKGPKFGKADIEKYMLEAGTTRLKSELTTRINSARNHLTNSCAVANFHKELALAKEQLRQASLIRAAIKE